VDPTGTAIKLEEYFSLFAQDIPFMSGLFEGMVPAAMFFSFLLTSLEIVIGIALLVNYRAKITSSVLLGLVSFFTLLTWYSYQFDKVTDCGCFGDAMPLTPGQSFSKDLLLMIFSLLIFLLRKKDAQKNNPLKIDVAILGAWGISLLFAYVNLSHLPLIDFRPYAIGNNLDSLSKDGEDPVYKFKFLDKTKNEEVISEEYLTGDNFEYTGYLEEGGKQATLADFQPMDSEGNISSDLLLNGTQYWIVWGNVKKNEEVADQIRDLFATQTKESPAYFLTSSSFDQYADKNLGYAQYFELDETVIKAMIRSNPGLVKVKDGIVLDKWHLNDLPETLAE
jgi:uncharacterized membrane protein YphA (DoxX/SURF4 family)